MDRSNNSAHAQQPGGALHHLLQPDGSGDHRINHHHPAGDVAFDAEAVEADAGDEFAAAQAEGNSRPVFQRPFPGVPRDHAAVPGGRGEPLRLPGPNDCPDAHPDRTVPSVDPGCVLPTRQPGWPLGKVIYLDSGGVRILGGADGFTIPMAGPRQVRPQQPDYPGARLRVHVGPAEDDHAAVDRSAAVGQPGNDALVDALDDCVFHVHAAQRSGALLDNVQRHWHRYPICRDWRMGTPIPVVPQIRAGGGASSGSPAIPRRPTGGDGK